MSNYAPRTNSKEQEAYANFQETINIYMQHPLPDGALERTKEYAERIKERLENKGWTQADLARNVGVSKQTISNMINASSSTINLRRLYVVSAAFECTPSYMLGLVEKDIDHHDKDTNEKSTWDPILSIDTAMKRFQNILHEACRTDPFFVDFICQIVENKDIPRANRIMMDSRLAKQRKFEPGFIPDSWIAEWKVLRRIEDEEMMREIDRLKMQIARQKRQISGLQKMIRGKRIKKKRGRLLSKRIHWKTTESQPLEREEQGVSPGPLPFCAQNLPRPAAPFCASPSRACNAEHDSDGNSRSVVPPPETIAGELPWSGTNR